MRWEGCTAALKSGENIENSERHKSTIGSWGYLKLSNSLKTVLMRMGHPKSRLKKSGSYKPRSAQSSKTLPWPKIFFQRSQKYSRPSNSSKNKPSGEALGPLGLFILAWDVNFPAPRERPKGPRSIQNILILSKTTIPGLSTSRTHSFLDLGFLEVFSHTCVTIFLVECD